MVENLLKYGNTVSYPLLFRVNGKDISLLLCAVGNMKSKSSIMKYVIHEYKGVYRWFIRQVFLSLTE